LSENIRDCLSSNMFCATERANTFQRLFGDINKTRAFRESRPLCQGVQMISKLERVLPCPKEIHQIFRMYQPNCGKMSYLAMLQNPSKKLLNLDAATDDLKHLMVSSCDQ